MVDLASAVALITALSAPEPSPGTLHHWDTLCTHQNLAILLTSFPHRDTLQLNLKTGQASANPCLYTVTVFKFDWWNLLLSPSPATGSDLVHTHYTAHFFENTPAHAVSRGDSVWLTISLLISLYTLWRVYLTMVMMV